MPYQLSLTPLDTTFLPKSFFFLADDYTSITIGGRHLTNPLPSPENGIFAVGLAPQTSEITFRDGGLTIQDLAHGFSRFGTLLNGDSLRETAASFPPIPLQDGDELQFGYYDSAHPAADLHFLDPQDFITLQSCKVIIRRLPISHTPFFMVPSASDSIDDGPVSIRTSASPSSLLSAPVSRAQSPISVPTSVLPATSPQPLDPSAFTPASDSHALDTNDDLDSILSVASSPSACTPYGAILDTLRSRTTKVASVTVADVRPRSLHAHELSPHSAAENTACCSPASAPLLPSTDAIQADIPALQLPLASSARSPVSSSSSVVLKVPSSSKDSRPRQHTVPPSQDRPIGMASSNRHRPLQSAILALARVSSAVHELVGYRYRLSSPSVPSSPPPSNIRHLDHSRFASAVVALTRVGSAMRDASGLGRPSASSSLRGSGCSQPKTSIPLPPTPDDAIAKHLDLLQLPSAYATPTAAAFHVGSTFARPPMTYPSMLHCDSGVPLVHPSPDLGSTSSAAAAFDPESLSVWTGECRSSYSPGLCLCPSPRSPFHATAASTPGPRLVFGLRHFLDSVHHPITSNSILFAPHLIYASRL
ncbi:hypothetical protein CF326_g5976 [Tilletia indica]|nr:hypothetical protein CF326_g5976 [Tilletia indica]